MSEYIHGTEPEEQQRLTLLNAILLNEGSMRELRLQGGERILDVGSGLGQLSRAMARVSKTRVTGIERSAEQIAEAVRQAKLEGEERLVEFRRGDAIDLPLTSEEWGTFDVAHARFLLEHVPNPLDVVRQMTRAAKAGGRIVLEDDDHDVLRLHPEPAGFSLLWNTYQRTYDRLGNDPIVGRRLVQLLRLAGAKPLRNAWIFFGSCSGDPYWSVFVDNLIAVVTGAAAHIADVGTMDERQLGEAVDAIQTWRRRPDAAIWHAMAWAEGIKP
jgi:SAM-dependent methyltransferase